MTLEKKISPLDDLAFSTKAIYIIEQVIAHMLIPFLMGALLLRARKEPAHLKHLVHRVGLGPVGPNQAIWIYAASLGETRAASPLIYHLRSEGFNILLTHQSPAGLAEGARLFGKDTGVTQCYIPLDFFWAIRLFLRRSKPVALVVIGIEIWPALLIETARKKILVTLANGNLTKRANNSTYYLRRKINDLYQLFSHIFTITNSYRDRYLNIGVSPIHISVVGVLKFDQLIDPTHLLLSERLRSQFIGAKRILMIASSVEAEEHLLLPMVARLLLSDAALRVVWAPRSPQRFQAVADALSSMSIKVQKRSTLGINMNTLLQETQVLVGDSTGEMNVYYPLADLVFVGASLNDWGGHNIIEPMALGCPVVMGPSTWGIDFAAEPASIAGAFESLPDVTRLEARIANLLADPTTLSQMGAAATRFAKGRTGAAEKTCSGLKKLLQSPPSSQVVVSDKSI